MPEALEVFASYVQVWSLAQMLEWWTTPETVGFGGSETRIMIARLWDATQLILMLAALWNPKSKLFPSLAFGARILNVLRKAPLTFDAEYASALTDLPALLCVSLRHPRKTTLLPSRSIRLQLASLYVAMAFWKLNSSFLHPRYSCATTIAMQFLDAWNLKSFKILAGAFFSSAPTLAILAEFSIGLTIGLDPAVGALLGLAFHAILTLTPVAFGDGAAKYGVVCATRYFWLAPFAVARAWRRAVDYAEFAVHFSVGAVFLAATVTTRPAFAGGGYASLAAQSAVSPHHSSFGVDWAAGAFGVLASLVARGASEGRSLSPNFGSLLGGVFGAPPGGGPSGPTPSSPGFFITPTMAAADRRDAAAKKREGIVSIVAESSAPSICWVSVAAVLFYAFGAVSLGLLDVAAPTAYSGLRAHGGGNHVLGAPTGLLQRWYADTPSSVFSGGVVRVESCDSPFVDAVHPGDASDSLTNGTIELLRDFRHPPKLWNSAVSNVVASPATASHVTSDKKKTVGKKERRFGVADGVVRLIPAFLRRGRDADSFDGASQKTMTRGRQKRNAQKKPFERYTVPAYELARVVRAARDVDPRRKFKLVYARLDGPVGDEDWRRHSTRKLVQLDVHGVDTIKCEVLWSRGGKRRDFDALDDDPDDHRDESSGKKDCAPEDFLDGRTWSPNSLANILGRKLLLAHSYPLVPRLTLTTYEKHHDELHCYGY